MTDVPPPPPPSTGSPPPPPPPPIGGYPGAVPPPPPAFAPGGVAPGQPRPAPGLATAALVCGIVGLGLFIFLVIPILAVVFGFIATSKAKKAPPGSPTGIKRARAGWILGIIGLVFFAGFIVAASAEEFDDDVSVDDLEVGDCYDLPSEDDDDEIASLTEQDCDEPHDAELFAEEPIDIDGNEYPGEEAIRPEIVRICTGAAFEDYVGTTFRESRYDVYPLQPTEDSWAFGDRTIACFVKNPDGTSLTSSVEGSGD